MNITFMKITLDEHQIEHVKFLLSLIQYDEAAIEVARKIPMLLMDSETRQTVLGKGV